MCLEGIIESEIYQIQIEKCCMVSLEPENIEVALTMISIVTISDGGEIQLRTLFL